MEMCGHSGEGRQLDYCHTLTSVHLLQESRDSESRVDCGQNKGPQISEKRNKRFSGLGFFENAKLIHNSKIIQRYTQRVCSYSCVLFLSDEFNKSSQVGKYNEKKIQDYVLSVID